MSQVPTNSPLYDKKKEESNNPESQFEYLLGMRMTKTQKWAVVIGATLAIYGFAYYMNKKN